MYLFVDKKTNAVLHVANASPGDDRKPEQFFRGFDPATMDFGHAPDHFIPARFAIRRGLVVNLDPPQAETLAQARERRLREFSAQALALRAVLVPDYQLLNAGIGLYDEQRVQSLRDTVNAFRSEVQRLQSAIAKAKSTEELDALVPAFPAVIVLLKVAAAKPAKATKV